MFAAPHYSGRAKTSPLIKVLGITHLKTITSVFKKLTSIQHFSNGRLGKMTTSFIPFPSLHLTAELTSFFTGIHKNDNLKKKKRKEKKNPLTVPEFIYV